MNCISCESDRILTVSGKCSDLCVVRYKDIESDGYVPSDIGIGGGDYVEFYLCMECGTIQNSFPVHEDLIMSRLSGED